MSNNQNNPQGVPQVKSVELYAANENEKKSIREMFNQDTSVDLHDMGINTLINTLPPEDFGENEDCELLQNVIREMYYRISELEKQNAVYREALDKIKREPYLDWNKTTNSEYEKGYNSILVTCKGIAEQALNSKEDLKIG